LSAAEQRALRRPERQALQPEQEQRASERLVQAPGRQALPEVPGPVQERRALQPVRLEQQVLRQVREQERRPSRAGN
jgi:hypothetical protein